jgi:hypothetical protein
MNPNLKKITLSAAGTSEAFYHPGGAANFSVSGTFGGTSIAIERNLDDGTPPTADTWTALQDADGVLAITAAYDNTTAPLAPSWIRVVATGGTPDVEFLWSPVKFL